jgi:hypothetical protein
MACATARSRTSYSRGAKTTRYGNLGTMKRRATTVTWCDRLLTALLKRYADAIRIHLVLDNYVIHSSRRTQAFVETAIGRLVLPFLPPYCPQENRIERLWQDLHRNVTRNHRCTTMDELNGRG